MIGLTKRQREIIDFIESYLSHHRRSPSYREIQDFFGFASLGTVYTHVQTLKRKGALDKKVRGVRALSTPSVEKKKVVPLIGKLKGGFPIETYSQMIDVSLPTLPNEECYFLTVEGEGLLEECLQARDLVLVVPRTTFENGEMVIALIEGQTTVVKRAYLESPYIRFESNSPHIHPLTLREDHVQIQGVILLTLRSFSA